MRNRDSNLKKRRFADLGRLWVEKYSVQNKSHKHRYEDVKGIKPVRKKSEFTMASVFCS